MHSSSHQPHFGAAVAGHQFSSQRWGIRLLSCSEEKNRKVEMLSCAPAVVVHQCPLLPVQPLRLRLHARQRVVDALLVHLQQLQLLLQRLLAREQLHAGGQGHRSREGNVSGQSSFLRSDSGPLQTQWSEEAGDSEDTSQGQPPRTATALGPRSPGPSVCNHTVCNHTVCNHSDCAAFPTFLAPPV